MQLVFSSGLVTAQVLLQFVYIDEHLNETQTYDLFVLSQA